MQTTCSARTAPLELPFVGQEKELARLEQLHAQRRPVLILGSAGVGKSALIRRVATRLPLLVCSESARLSLMFDALEQEMPRLEQSARMLVRKLAGVESHEPASSD